MLIIITMIISKATVHAVKDTARTEEIIHMIQSLILIAYCKCKTQFLFEVLYISQPFKCDAVWFLGFVLFNQNIWPNVTFNF